MSEINCPGPQSESCEAVCIHTNKIFDSCQSRDCIEDLRFYPAFPTQDILAKAQSVKGGRAELLHTYINVEPVAFNRGFYTADLRYFYRVTVNVYCGAPRPIEVEGLCVFDKRVVLFGSEGGAKIFSSTAQNGALDQQMMPQCNRPRVVVEAVDPIVLDTKLVDSCQCSCCECDICEIPLCVKNCFGCDLTAGEEKRKILVTLGQFSIVRLERDTQLLIPVYDYCIPDKECCSGCCKKPEDPCELFQSISFPVSAFYPPQSDECENSSGGFCGCKN